MSMGGTFNNKAGLEKGEVVLKGSRANLQTDFIMSQGGRLFLTNKRFILLPARFSIPTSAQKAEGIILDLARIKVVKKREERYVQSPCWQFKKQTLHPMQ